MSDKKQRRFLSDKMMKMIIKNKNADTKRDMQSIAPAMNDPGWQDAIYDATEHGIRLQCFYDVSNKITITVNHLPAGKGSGGHQAKPVPFRFYPWCDSDGWTGSDYKEQLKYFMVLAKFGFELARRGLETYWVSVNGTGRGYIRTKSQKMNDLLNDALLYKDPSSLLNVEKNSVLFVYCTKKEWDLLSLDK